MRKGPPADLRATLEWAVKAPDAREKNMVLVASLHAKVEEFQSLITENLVLREKILREANRLEAAFANQPKLAPADLKLVSEGAAKFLRLRDELLTLADRYQCLFEYSEADLLRNHVDPRLRLVAVMVSVGAALTLYDNYLTTVIRFEESAALRRFINDGDQATGMNRRAMEEIGQSARSLINRGTLRAAILSCEQWNQKYPEWKLQFQDVTGGLDVMDEDFAYLETLIGSSVAYRYITDVQPGAMTLTKLDSCLGRKVPDFSREGRERMLLLLSQIFVRSIAVVEPREGMLFAVPERRTETLAALNRMLKAGDILLEKSGFRLTDRAVPGYWGHSGIWLGTDEELDALGVWTDPRLQKLRAADQTRLRDMVRQGRSVIEALLGGVELNTLEHFLNVDDLAVLRPRMNDDSRRADERREVIVTALTHLGKNYDFGFDVHSRSRIVCSELVFQSYTHPEYRWPKSHTMGRYTLSPDHVARRALPADGQAPPLQLIVLYRRGERLNESPEALEAAIAALINVPAHERTYGPGGTLSGQYPPSVEVP